MSVLYLCLCYQAAVMLGMLICAWLLLLPSYDFGKVRTLTNKLLNAAIMLSMLIWRCHLPMDLTRQGP